MRRAPPAGDALFSPLLERGAGKLLRDVRHDDPGCRIDEIDAAVERGIAVRSRGGNLDRHAFRYCYERHALRKPRSHHIGRAHGGAIIDITTVYIPVVVGPGRVTVVVIGI